MSTAATVRRKCSSGPAQFAFTSLALLALCACQAAPLQSPAPGSPTPLPPTLTCTPSGAPVSVTPIGSTDSTPPATHASPEPQATQPGTPTPASGPEHRLDARHWRQWAIVPTVGPRGLEILSSGQASGADPHAFSTIGDCQSMPAVFMGMYDRPGGYILGEGFQTLQQTIDYFAGSFSRASVTVRNGMNVATVFSPLWADPALCRSGETPLECEFRLHRPAVVFVNLGTNSIPGGASTFEQYLRQIVEFCILHDALPILSTKADNLEEDYSINQATAQVAYDYELPLWNFWRAVQPLPHHGLDLDRGGTYLSTEAWGVRSFTGLQTLQAILRAMQDLPGVSPSTGNTS